MQISSWEINQDQPGELLALSGFWPPNAPRGLRLEKVAQKITVQPFLGGAFTIDFASLRGLRFFIGPESGRRLRLSLSILYKQGDEPRTTSLSFRVRELDRHEEALDWIFRVAQIVGWSSYLMYQKDEQGIELELRPESHDPFRADAQATHEVPKIKGPADYRLDLQSTKSLYEITRRDPLRPKFQEPREVSTFDPAAHPAVAAWSPPERLALRQEANSGTIGTIIHIVVVLPLLICLWILVDTLQFMVLLLFSFIGVIFVTMPLIILGETVHSLKWVASGAMTLTYVLLGLGFVLFFLLRVFELFHHVLRSVLLCFSREVFIEVKQGHLVLQRARIFWTRLSLSKLTAITLVRRENKMFKQYYQKKTRGEGQESCYQVKAKLGLFSVSLWEGHEAKTPDRQEAYSLAVALARVLDVPFREE